MDTATSMLELLNNKKKCGFVADNSYTTLSIAERRNRAINADAQRRLDMDSYIRSGYQSSRGRWTLYRAVNQLDSYLHNTYRFSTVEILGFYPPLSDLIQYGIITPADETSDDAHPYGTTARVILRVAFNDDYEAFVDYFAAEAGFVKKP